MTVYALDVLDIMSASLTAAQIAPYLVTAQQIISDNATAGGWGDTLKDQITKYLAAHIASVQSPFAIEQSILDARDKYGYRGGEGLKATPYGETVLLLDASGILRTRMGGRVMQLEAIDFPVDDDD